MVGKFAPSRITFLIIVYMLLTLLAVVWLIPFLHLIMVSLSSKGPADAGRVFLWPIDFTFWSYVRIFQTNGFLNSVLISVARVAVGVTLTVLLTILAAYPLSKEKAQFKGRTVIAWFLIVGMIFADGGNGTMVPWYLTVRAAGLVNTFWALVIPSAVRVYYIVLLLNFFRGLPKDIEEAALVDGAGHWTILWMIIVPMSMPGIATIALFTLIEQWNAWFDGFIFINDPIKAPLMTFLQTIIVSKGKSANNWQFATPEMLSRISDSTVQAAYTVISMVPILIIFPFFQTFLKKGIVLGSVKG